MEKRTGIILAIVETDYFQEKIEELKNLCATINIEVVDVFTQNLDERRVGLLGKGKLQEIVNSEVDFDVVITYQNLSNLDMRVLGEIFNREILDKQRVILNIFALRAQSKLAKMEVELAGLYLKRDELVGSYQAYSRQVGGSGAIALRGGGEQQLQVDRRRINQRITRLKKAIHKEKQSIRVSQRRQKATNIFTVALIGYTNAGKSTLFNRLLAISEPDKSHKPVLSKDQVFSSLDVTTRKIEISGYPSFLIVDTVGFVIDLPRDLVASFHSTLASLENADCIVEVLDGSYDLTMQLESIDQFTQSIAHDNIIKVINKKDLLTENHTPFLAISAKTAENIDVLLEQIKHQHLMALTKQRGYIHKDNLYRFYQDERVYVEVLDEAEHSLYCDVYYNQQNKYLLNYMTAQAL